MGEKTVVHIFAEEFIEINRMFCGSCHQLSERRISFVALCFTAIIHSHFYASFFILFIYLFLFSRIFVF
jgi:hypothetical protein